MLEFWNDLGWMDGVGVCGSLLLCIAYAAVSNQWLASNSVRFQVMNLLGALLLLASLCTRPNYGAILIEVVWATIAFSTLCRIRFSKRGARKSKSA